MLRRPKTTDLRRAWLAGGRRPALGGRWGWGPALALCLVLAAGADSARDAIEQLSPAAREHLARQRDRLAQLPEAEQARLRQLAHDLETAPDGPELRAIMLRYFEWIRQSVSAAELAELRQMPLDKRVQQIAEWKSQRTSRSELVLSGADREALSHWIEQQFSERFGPPGQRTSRAVGARPRWMAFLLGRDSEEPLRGMLPNLSPAALEALAQGLSAEPAALVRSSRPSEVRRLLNQWISQTVRADLPPIDADELARYFEEQLSPKDRDQLLALEPEAMDLRLRLRYLRSKRADRPRMRPGGRARSGAGP